MMIRMITASRLEQQGPLAPIWLTVLSNQPHPLCLPFGSHRVRQILGRELCCQVGGLHECLDSAHCCPPQVAPLRDRDGQPDRAALNTLAGRGTNPSGVGLDSAAPPGGPALRHRRAPTWPMGRSRGLSS